MPPQVAEMKLKSGVRFQHFFLNAILRSQTDFDIINWCRHIMHLNILLIKFRIIYQNT